MSGRFVMVPAALVLSHIDAEALRLWMVLASYQGNGGACWPSLTMLAETTNTTKRSVQRLLRSLEEQRLISITRGSGRTRSTYTVRCDATDAPEVTPQTPQRCQPCHPRGDATDTPEVTPQTPQRCQPCHPRGDATDTPEVTPQTPQRCQPEHPRGDSCVTSEVTPVSPSLQYNRNILIKVDTSPARDARARGQKEYDASFSEFWAAYPRKDAKEAAKRKWHSLKPDAVLVASIVAGLERSKRSDQWTRDGGKYIPYAATWLNQRRWEDEPAPAQSAPQRTAAAKPAAQPEDEEALQALRAYQARSKNYLAQFAQDEMEEETDGN